MEIDDVRHLVLDRFWKSFAGKDVAGAVACFADDIEYEDLCIEHVAMGRAEVLQMWQAWFEAAGDSFAADLDHAVIGTDGYALEWTVRGWMNGAFGSIPGTGQPFEVRGTSVGRVAGGAIVRNRDYWNLASILRQLGVTHLP